LCLKETERDHPREQREEVLGWMALDPELGLAEVASVPVAEKKYLISRVRRVST